jgi:hypothetical protein
MDCKHVVWALAITRGLFSKLLYGVEAARTNRKKGEASPREASPWKGLRSRVRAAQASVIQ